MFASAGCTGKVGRKQPSEGLRSRPVMLTVSRHHCEWAEYKPDHRQANICHPPQ